MIYGVKALAKVARLAHIFAFGGAAQVAQRLEIALRELRVVEGVEGGALQQRPTGWQALGGAVRQVVGRQRHVLGYCSQRLNPVRCPYQTST